MICPRCGSDSTVNTKDNNYICLNSTCKTAEGRPTQFQIITDDKKYFPYNIIFKNRNLNEFYKKSYMIIDH